MMITTRAWGVVLLFVVMVAQAALPPNPSEDIERRKELRLNVSTLTSTEVQAFWTFEGNETNQFEVTWSPPNEYSTSSASTNDTWYTITALTPCTSYTVSVRAVDDVNQTIGLSDNETAMTAIQATNVSSLAVDAVAEHPSQLDVSWKTQDDLGNCYSNFSVMWGRLDNTMIGEAVTDDTEYAISGLDASTPYNVCVATCLSDFFSVYPVCAVNQTVEDYSTPIVPPWVVGVSVAVVIVFLVATSVGIYVFKNKSRPPHGILPPQNVEVHSSAVRSSDLRRHIKLLEEDTQRGLEEEFGQVLQRSGKHSALAAVEDLNKPKNRFRNIHPFDHSRVILPVLPGVPCSDYINANYVMDANGRKQFVASQGPTRSTTGDFWRMVWHVGANVVVMLTKLREKGKERCVLYWPTTEEPTVIAGNLTVSSHGDEGTGDLRVREFLLHQKKEERLVRQYHLTAWPDFGIPSHDHYLLDFICKVRDDVSPGSFPIVVHCSAGVGRTGTFIGLWNLMDIADAGQAPSLDVQQTVLKMRECRPNMVQTSEQYLYLYKSIATYLEEPTRWRRKTNTKISIVPVPTVCKDDMFAFDNPTFIDEAEGEQKRTSKAPAAVEERECL